jgi:hypothetical protein
MAMSDCPKCWDTPCTCGWDWRQKPLEDLIKQRDILLKAIEFKTKNPNAKFSNYGIPDTEDDISYMKEVK